MDTPNRPTTRPPHARLLRVVSGIALALILTLAACAEEDGDTERVTAPGPGGVVSDQPIGGGEGEVDERVLVDPIAEGEPPALNPELLLLTYVGGPGDQLVRDVGFTDDGRAFATGNHFTFYADTDGGNAMVEGEPSAADDENYPKRPQLPGRPGRLYEDARSGMRLRIGYEQIGGNLQRPIFRAFESDTAEEAIWGFWEASAKQLEDKHLVADSRCYQMWAMPDGDVGIQCWTDGGNSVLETDPRSLDDGKSWATDDTFQRGAGGMATLYGRVDPSTGTLVSGTFVDSHVAFVTSDDWGRVYLATTVKHKQTNQRADNPFGMPGESGTGLTVLDPSLAKVLLNVKISGTWEKGLEQRWLDIAIRDGVLVLGGVSDVTDMPSVGHGAQAGPGGGKDGIVAIVRLW